MRVTFVRGPRRVVLGPDSSSVWVGRLWVIRVDVDGDGSLLLEVSEDEDGGVVNDGASMSVVTGGLVLVMVAVVVGVDDAWVAVAVKDGSTKLSGACSAGSLNRCAANVATAMTMPMTARPATLAKMAFGVRLYHGVR
ncbi:MAG TPA: hypothetical protein VFK56_19470 [Mycobacterium sp.]|nr:hypothetical protein [Mycobacterium sp.]